MVNPVLANPLARNSRRIATSFSAVKHRFSGTNQALGVEFKNNTRFFNDSSSDSPDFNPNDKIVPGYSLSKNDLDKIKSLIQEDREELLEQIKELGHWDLEYAREKIIKELEDQGMSHEEAVDEFNRIDDEVDRARAAMKSPYILGAAIPAAAIPASWSLVYHQPFYDWVASNWPWLTMTSWDWSEPLLQSLLATEVGATLMFASFSALGYQNYKLRVNKSLVDKLVNKTGVSRKTAKKFIKVDIDNRQIK